MIQRDKDILESLRQFRVLNRDQLIELHFKGLKQDVTVCNRVMRRLQLLGEVDVDRNVRPYVYFPNPTSVSKNSSKLKHFRAIADIVIEAKALGEVRELVVEPKLGAKGTVEPDIFMIWNNTPFFVEVQTANVQKSNYMVKKLERYENYFLSNQWKSLHWQRPSKPVFPYVLILSRHPYQLKDTPFHVLQVKSLEDFMRKYVR